MPNIFVCNAGSSSLKFGLYEAEREILQAEGIIDWTQSPARLTTQRTGEPKRVKTLSLRNHAEAIPHILDHLGDVGIYAVGHRVVHGGDRYTSAVLITPETTQALEEIADLAPLHNPASIEGIRACQQALPGVPQVAAFDTAFHTTMAPAVSTYPVPRQWTDEWRIRRYGFHGLSHSYCSGRAAELLRRPDARLIIAHLGNGASVTAVRDGRCVDTSMGFTPLEGLMMGTRSGSIDPGILIHLMRTRGLDADQLDHALNFESGLLGVSGVSSDMREVLTAAPTNPAARLAIEIYVHRVRQTIGAMAATLDGVDALVFTAGVGENSSEIRRQVCGGLNHLGLTIDSAANDNCTPDADIATASSRGRILVVATKEALTVLRQTWQLTRPIPSARPFN